VSLSRINDEPEKQRNAKSNTRTKFLQAIEEHAPQVMMDLAGRPLELFQKADLSHENQVSIELVALKIIGLDFKDWDRQRLERTRFRNRLLVLRRVRQALEE
jgi:hypothetical protein